MRIHLREELAGLADSAADSSLTLVSAPGGTGKTTMARAWQQRLRESGTLCGWVGLSEAHADLPFFLQEMIDSLREAIAAVRPDAPEGHSFGDSILRLMSVQAELDPQQVRRRLTIELRSLFARPVIVLDAFEHLPETSPVIDLVDALMRSDPIPARWILTTRGRRPAAFARLAAAGEVVEIDSDELSLRASQVTDILIDEGVEPTGDLVTGLLARTRGWAIAVRLMARSLLDTAPEDRLDRVRALGEQEDLFDYIGRELISRVSEDALHVLEIAARLGPATPELMLAASDPRFDRPKGLREAREAGLLLGEGGVLFLHDLWREWLLSPIRRESGEESEAALRMRLAEALMAADHPERAVEQALLVGPTPEAQVLIENALVDFGHAWLSAGRRGSVERGLGALPASRIEAVPSLSALEGLQLSGSDPDRAIAHYERACRAYRDAGNVRAEAECLHELGVIAINENRPDVVARIRSRALAVTRAASTTPLRGMFLMALGMVAQVSGRQRAAMRLLDSARTYDHHPREYGGIVLVQATILFFEGRWNELLRRLDEALLRPEQRRHGTSYSTLLVYRAMIEGARGIDPERQRLRLEEASDFFGQCHYTNSRIRTELALANQLRREGRLEEALARVDWATALARRIELNEAVGACLGIRARIHRIQGDDHRALAAAEEALDALPGPEAWSVHQGLGAAFVPGVLLACLVVGELGEAATAARFLEEHRRRIARPGSPLVEHMRFDVQSRIAGRLGDATKAEEELRRAWRRADRAGLEGFAPEFDERLLARSATEARNLGLESEVLSRALEETGVVPDPEIAVDTLGGLALRMRGRVVPERAWRGVTTRRLLARMLISGGHGISRERLEATLWPDATRSKAGTHFRTTLLRLRDVLEPRRKRDPSAPSLIRDEGDRVVLADAVLEGWDVFRWREAFARAHSALSAGSRSRWLRCLDQIESLAGGPFLPELDDPWIIEERSSLEIERSRGSIELSRGLLEWGDPESARRCARWAISTEVDPLAGWTVVIESYREEGDLLGARQAFAEARSTLSETVSDAELSELEAQVSGPAVPRPGKAPRSASPSDSRVAAKNAAAKDQAKT